MSTLIEKLENITSTQDDDYFSSDFKLEVLNRAKDHTISIGASIESQRKKSLRFLDSLRKTQGAQLNLFAPYKGFYLVIANLPSDLSSLIYVDINGMKLVELYDDYEVYHGNAIPNKTEGYFTIYDNEVTFFLYDDTLEFVLFRYIKKHPPITINTEDSSLGATAENAMLHYAAGLMTQTDATLPSEQYFQVFNDFINDFR